MISKKNIFSLALLLIFFSCKQQEKTPAANNTVDKPNIIYIYADDLGYGETAPYGQEKIRTPHLAQMASEGMTFIQHYTSAPVCAPARSALMTGLHTGHTPIRGNLEYGESKFNDQDEQGQEPLPPNTATLGTVLKKAGYKTGIIGKWGLGMTGNTGHPNHQGFDYFYGYLDQKQAHNYYPTHLWENTKWDSLDNPFIYVHNPRSKKNKRTKEAKEAFEKSHLNPEDEGFFAAYKGNEYAIDPMTAKAEKFIREKKDSAFFLYLPYTIPHVSLQVPDSAVAQYLGHFEESAYLGQQSYAPHQFPKSAYAAMITYLDSQVGRIMNQLKRLGLEENTIIFFSSDNGPTFNGGVDAGFFNSTGGLRGLKMDLYEGGIRMPMIARWPGKIEKGSTTDHISAQYDVLATVCDIASVEAPKTTDGISFLPTLLGKKEEQQQHKFLYFEYPEKRGQVAVRMGKWKGIKLDLIPHPDNPWQLFNLEKDQKEANDVAQHHPEILQQLDEIVKEEHSKSHVKKWNFLDKVYSRAALTDQQVKL